MGSAVTPTPSLLTRVASSRQVMIVLVAALIGNVWTTVARDTVSL